MRYGAQGSIETALANGNGAKQDKGITHEADNTRGIPR